MSRTLKRKIIIPPGAVHVAQDFDHGAITCETSPFSDGYDLAAEAEELGDRVNEELDETHRAFLAWESFHAHELLLKHYILRTTARTRRGRRISGRSPSSVDLSVYEIYPSEERMFAGIGGLKNHGDAEDFISLHTKQAVRMWEGVNTPERGASRWAGIRYGITLSAELVWMTQRDHPFAHAALMEFERNLDSAAAYLDERNRAIEEQLRQYAQEGLHISVFANDEPVNIQVKVSSYGFKLLQLLMAYDLFVRQMKTVTLKGLMPNRAGNNVIYEGGNQVRSMLQSLYRTTTRMRAIKQLTRKALLDDVPQGIVDNLASAVSESVLNPVPLSVLRYEQLPQYASLTCPHDAKVLNKLAKLALAKGLAVADVGVGSVEGF